MATGIPVVTSSVSSLPEVVGDAAMIVNPENVFDIARGIREVLIDEDLRAGSLGQVILRSADSIGAVLPNRRSKSIAKSLSDPQDWSHSHTGLTR